MQRTLIALGCALALTGGSALAQQQTQQGTSASSPSGTGGSSGGGLLDKAKQTAQTIGEKAKEATGRALDKTQQAAESSGSSDPKVEQLQKQADADYKSAKAQCDTVQPAQKTLCEKQATAKHAAAEVEVEKAKVAAQGQAQGQGGSTSTMGAGKSPK